MRSSLKAALSATVFTVIGAVAAQATPVPAGPAFTNPNFTSTSTTTTFAYSVPISGWTDASGAGAATGIASKNPSYFWDNGIAPNLETTVAFLQNETSALQQSVMGFIVGHQYKISVTADARAATGPAGLSIGVNGVEYGSLLLTPNPVAAVDAYSVYATPWATYTSAAFTASAVMNLIQLQNTGIPGSAAFDDVTIDLGNATITDVTVPAGVPEPASLALLAFGFGGALLARRRMLARRS